MSPTPAAALILAVVLLHPPTSRARDPEALTLSQALAIARERSVRVLEARTRVSEAEGGLQGASALLAANPMLEVAAGPRIGDSPRGVDLGVTLSQSLELGGQGAARREGARAALEQARAGLQVATRAAERETAAAFFRALHARARTLLAEEDLETATQLTRLAQRRLEEGEVTALDQNLSRISEARARAGLSSAKRAEVDALDGLRALLALHPSAPLVVQGDLTDLPPVTPSEPPPASPGLRVLEAELEEARAVAREVAPRVPDVTVGVSYEREVEETVIKGVLGVPLPLFQRREGARMRAAAGVVRAELTLSAATAAQALALQTAQRHDALASGAAAELATVALPLLEDTLALSTRSYAAGELGLDVLLLIRRDALETRLAILDHRLEAALARVELTVLLGVLP